MFAAYGRHTEANPKYQAAVRAQREKEGRAISIPNGTKSPLSQILDRLVEAKRQDEERWHYEFQQAITTLRLRSNMAPTLEILNAKIQAFQQEREQSTVARRTAGQVIREGVIGTPFSVEDIKGPRRHRPLTRLRMLLIAKVYVECPHLSLPQIGKAFGGRDHTTILHSVVKMGVHQRACDYGQRGLSKAA